MGLITCPDCRKSISDSAIACPHCGIPKADIDARLAKPEAKMFGKKLTPAFGCFIAAVVLVFVGIAVMFQDKKNATQTETPGVTQHLIFDTAITAGLLATEYKANEIRADADYKGKILSVTGNVDSIGKDVLDTMYITFQSEHYVSVQAFFDDAFAARLANLQKGELVTVTCKCDGKFGNVLLKECTLR